MTSDWIRWTNSLPIASMYGIFTYIYHKMHPTVRLCLMIEITCIAIINFKAEFVEKRREWWRLWCHPLLAPWQVKVDVHVDMATYILEGLNMNTFWPFGIFFWISILCWSNTFFELYCSFFGWTFYGLWQQVHCVDTQSCWFGLQ